MAGQPVDLFAPIPGSSMRRAYCARCRDAMRITTSDAVKAMKAGGVVEFLCLSCDPQHEPVDRGAVLTQRQRECLGRTRS